jgi:hypothetical protein
MQAALKADFCEIRRTQGGFKNKGGDGSSPSNRLDPRTCAARAVPLRFPAMGDSAPLPEALSPE